MRILMTVVALSACVLPAHPALAADADAGETRFKQLCATCHGPTGQGDGLSPMMTAFGHLSDGDIDNLIAYIRSLDD